MFAQISEGSTALKDKEDDIYKMIDGIKDTTIFITSKANDLQSQNETLKGEAEEEDTEGETDWETEGTDTMVGCFKYETNNLLDEQILAEFAMCIASVQPDVLLAQLQTMHPDYRGV